MSGYFRRLIAQSAITTTQVRPASVHPYAVSTGRPASPIEETLESPSDGATGIHRSEAGSAADSRASEGAAQGRRIIARAPQIIDRAIRQKELDAPLDVSEQTRSAAMPPHRMQHSGQASPQLSNLEARKPVESTGGDRRRTGSDRPGEIESSPASLRADSNFRLLPELGAAPMHPALAAPRPLHDQANHAPAGAAVVRATTKLDEGSREAAPQVHVTIGRIEVIAQHAQPPTRKRRERPAATSLDEYLSQRRQGGV